MAQPIVSWYNFTNDAQVTQWPLGTVDAGTTSEDRTFLIWNNRGGTEDVSDMTDCAITTKDAAGGDTGDLVVNRWIEAKVDTMAEATFTPIGGTSIKAIKAGNPAPAGTIRGTANDGTKTNSVPNFAQVTLHANVPPIATAGNIDFLLRVHYRYT